MRELGFRAWSNEHNRYCDFVTLDENDRWIGWIKSSGVYLTTTDIVLEQYIGLKDKNGKEIYEGDIVKLEMWDNRLEKMVYIHTTEVIWNTRYARFDTTHRDVLSDELADDCFEIIGNIHENPEMAESAR